MQIITSFGINDFRFFHSDFAQRLRTDEDAEDNFCQVLQEMIHLSVVGRCLRPIFNINYKIKSKKKKFVSNNLIGRDPGMMKHSL